MRRFEDFHWWYRGLRRLAVDEIDGAGSIPPAGRILDAGCGTGGMLEVLRAKFPEAELSGIDASETAVELTRRRTTRAGIEQASIESLPFPASHFDAVISLDVLYFENLDEHRALAEFHRVLKPGGRLFLNLPALEALRGEHDRAVSGARRYAKKGLGALLTAAGFRIERLFYWNAWCVPLLLAWRPISRRLYRNRPPKSDLRGLPGPCNTALESVSRLDIELARRLPLPFGSSLFAVSVRMSLDAPPDS